ncbi:MAG TPA: dimethylsulfonioproprionate lyase family protein, partial [Chloroflexota bacterium]|nr:dimethylsulfonioproprionate lyase family protein [Chloroflexota bacterium]
MSARRKDLPRDLTLLLEILRRRYAAEAAVAKPALAAELVSLLEAWPNVRQPVSANPSQLPASAYFIDALAAGTRGPEAALASGLAALASFLRWTYSYPARRDQPDLAKRVAFSQIVGPGGLLRSDELRLGLTLIAPTTQYPAHHHPAIETYLVVSGTASWRLGSEHERPQPPGTCIFHPSGEAHAMRSHEDPLLAIYSWRGDVLSP